MPFVGKKSDKDAAQKKSDAATKTADKQKGEKVEEAAPKPGDIKVIDGVEYIYARNKKYMLTPYEPENVWIRKDLYSPGVFDSLFAGRSTDPKEQKEIEARIAKLEEELKKKGIQPQMAYPAQVVNMPGGGMGYIWGAVALLSAIAIFVVGHVFNVVINLLGAFVHPARLQFVEFFSKFYEGGGHPLKPFRFATRSVVLGAGEPGVKEGVG